MRFIFVGIVLTKRVVRECAQKSNRQNAKPFSLNYMPTLNEKKYTAGPYSRPYHLFQIINYNRYSISENSVYKMTLEQLAGHYLLDKLFAQCLGPLGSLLGKCVAQYR